MKIELEVTKVAGGYIVAAPEFAREAVASTPKQAGLRAKEIVEAILEKEEKK